MHLGLFSQLHSILCLTPITTLTWFSMITVAITLINFWDLSPMWAIVGVYSSLALHEVLAFFVMRGSDSVCFPSSERVPRIYEWLSLFLDRVKNVDLTEGYFDGDFTKTLEQATVDKYERIIELLDLKGGDCVLDVGCGQGDFLVYLKKKGIRGVGLTISPDQAQICRGRGLDVRCGDFRDPLTADLVGAFKAVIFMGCLEHFVQGYATPEQAQEIYNRAFKTAHLALDSGGRIFSTTLHKNLQYQWHLRDYFYGYLLHGFYSGYYPGEGDLQKASSRYFQITHKYDASLDYQWSSIICSNHFGLAKITWTWEKVMYAILRFLINPFEICTWLYYGLGAWMWQFGGTEIVSADKRPASTLWYVYDHK